MSNEETPHPDEPDIHPVTAVDLSAEDLYTIVSTMGIMLASVENLLPKSLHLTDCLTDEASDLLNKWADLQVRINKGLGHPSFEDDVLTLQDTEGAPQSIESVEDFEQLLRAAEAKGTKVKFHSITPDIARQLMGEMDGDE